MDLMLLNFRAESCHSKAQLTSICNVFSFRRSAYKSPQWYKLSNTHTVSVCNIQTKPVTCDVGPYACTTDNACIIMSKCDGLDLIAHYVP